MVAFAGYWLPIQYSAGITAEHQAVRNRVGLFDVSHMGEIEVSGPEALELVQYLTGNDASQLDVGQAQYSTLLRQNGSIVDDLLVYRLGDRYMLVVNASNRKKDLEWISRYAPNFDAVVTDRSDEIALLALQGPRSAQVLGRLTGIELEKLSYYRFVAGDVAGCPTLVSRTGYTGEDGFELFVAAADGAHLWRALLEAGQADEIIPVGLGARDSLRLEMGYALYGNDIDDTRTTLEAGLGWVTKLDKGNFIARDALLRLKEQGAAERLVGFRLLERGFPRPKYEIHHAGGQVGTVTSGTLSPSLGVGIGLGYVTASLAKPGTRLYILIRGQPIPAEVVKTPFYTAGSVRR
jgi:aminomethyltransferase